MVGPAQHGTTEPSPTSSVLTFTRLGKAVSWSSTRSTHTFWRANIPGFLQAVRPCFTWKTVPCWSTEGLSSGCHRLLRRHANAQRQRVSGPSRCGRSTGREALGGCHAAVVLDDRARSVHVTYPGQSVAGPAAEASCSPRRPHPRTVDEGLDEVSR